MNNRIVYTLPEPGKINKRRRGTERKRKKTLGIILAVVLFCVIIAGIVYLIRLPSLQIKKIEFSGLTALNETELRDGVASRLNGDFLFVLPKKFYFFVRPQALAAWLKNEFPPIGRVAVKKRLPDSLRIEVSERNLFGILCRRGTAQKDGGGDVKKCVFVDRNGIAYEDAPNTEGSLIRKIDIDAAENKLDIGSRVLNPDMIKRMEEIDIDSRAFTGSAVTGYQLFSKIPDEIRVLNSEGYKIYLNAQDDFKKSFKILKTALEKEIKDKRDRLDYVDLRFGNKVFYKFRN